ncbi:MAG: ATP-binding protein [Propionibacteriales bacterium]|nr:ATP-binding protein [Propionibacteriales bacterium]
MTPFAPALLGFVLGAGIGALVVWLLVRRAARQVRGQIINRHHLGEILGPLGAAVVVLSESDFVLATSTFARRLGIVRGSAIVGTELQHLLAEARRTGQVARAEIRIAGPAEEPVVLAVRVLVLSNQAAVLIGEDRSHDLRFTETRRDFVANITHELKTPIGAIGLLAEAAEAAADDPDAVRSFLGKLTREADRLNELVSQIIALSRLQAVDPLLDAQLVDVAGLLSAASTRCAHQAEAGQVSLSVQAEPGLVISGDPGELETAVTNLAQNAVAYSEPGAKVALTSGRGADGMIEIRVSDNGIGISEADQKRIFERFFRVDADRSRATGGTGLGLSIVKHVAAAHGGEVTVWSRVGQGSTFTLRLPDGSEGGTR